LLFTVIKSFATASYALNIAKLDLDEKTPPAMVGFVLNSHTIAKASVIAYYQR
jgi:phosphatidylethanolamine-binding protein (PEBP) family uncharacterized protein